MLCKKMFVNPQFCLRIIAGVDFALVQNGYVYHTKYDKPSLIPNGTYQRIGDNVLAMVKSLVNSEELMSSEVSAAVRIVATKL